MMVARDREQIFAISCRYCQAVILDDVSRIDEGCVNVLHAHVLACERGPFVRTVPTSSLIADRLRELGVLLKHFDVSASRDV